MAVTIRRGTTDDARREYVCFILAYACMEIKQTADAVTVWTFDEDAAAVFAGMEHNQVTDIKTGAEAIAAVMAA